MKYQISIPKPCHEDWSSMTPNEKGRFCGACSKTVVDFRRMSTKEIVSHLEKSSGNTCGRFANNQLGEQTVETKSRWTKWLAAAALVLSLSPAPLAAQSKMEKTEQTNHYTHTKVEEIQVEMANPSPKKLIRGRVMDPLGEMPLIGVAVRVIGTDHGGITDENGYFSFELSDSFSASSVNILISYIGYKSERFCIQLDNEQAEYKIGEVQLEESEYTLMGDISFIPPTRLGKIKESPRRYRSVIRRN